MANTVAPEKAKAIVEIERLGFKFTEDSAYDLSRLDPARRIQVRESEHYAPREGVERYAVQMGQSVFPPIVVTKDAWIIDGNTRVGASLRRKTSLFPAIVLDVEWNGADTKTLALLIALAATLNSQNGEPLTARERRRVSAELIEMGWKTEQIARAIGVGVSTVTQVKQELDAVEKIQKVGLTNGHMIGASLRALGKSPALTLNDAPFRELATLVEAAGLSATEITQMAKQARETGSDQGALDVLTKARVEMGDRIRERNLTGVVKPPIARQLRQHLGFVNKYVGNPGAFVETNTPVIAQHVEAITTAISVLQAALVAQNARA